jgi:hypothetical protein
MRCLDCDHDFECCHSTSITHADGVSECLGDTACELAHGLHRWALACDEAGCSCRLEVRDGLPIAA